MSERQIVVSGIRATGRLHLGNYLGVLRRFAEMSHDDRYECYFFVADLHTLTTSKEGALIAEHLPNIVLDYLAAGVDPNRAHLYVQSDIPSVTELAWYLSCLTNVTDLLTLPTYKDKVSKGDVPNAGLLSYPVLMAADILGPRANLVPVGKDQKSHLELAQKLAGGFNRQFMEFFPIPDALTAEMLLIPGLSAMDERGGFPKMGKSDGNTINLSDSPEITREKIRVAPTDPKRIRRNDVGTPEHCVIHMLHTHISSEATTERIRQGCRTASIGCIECKQTLADGVNDTLAEFRDRRLSLGENPSIVKEVLFDGMSAVAPRFAETIETVRECFGISRQTHQGDRQ